MCAVQYVLTCSFTPLGSSFKNINPERRGGEREEAEERRDEERGRGETDHDKEV